MWALLCVAKPSTASTNDSTKTRGLELHRNIGMAKRFEDIETDTGTCLPIQVVVSVFSSFSSGIQIDSKSKTARLLKSFSSSVYWILNKSSYSITVFLGVDTHSLYKYASLVHCIWPSEAPSFRCFGKMYRKLDSEKTWRVHGCCLRNIFDYYIGSTELFSRTFWRFVVQAHQPLRRQ